MIRRKCKYNYLSERNKRTPAAGSPKSSSSWSLFTIKDASEDSGQSSGAHSSDEKKTYLNDAIRNKPNEEEVLQNSGICKCVKVFIKC